MARIPERVQALEELGPDLEVAGHRPSLDHRKALPRLARGRVVVFELGKGAHKGARRPFRAQAHVRAEKEPVPGALPERTGKGLGDLRVELPV